MATDSGSHDFDGLPEDLQQQILTTTADLSRRIAAIDPDLVLHLAIGAHPDQPVGADEETPARESIIAERWSAKIWPKVEFMKIRQPRID